MKAHNKNFLFSIRASVICAINRQRKFFTKHLLIFAAIMVMSGLHHARSQAFDDYNDTAVLKADTIIWYGLDLSHMQINEPAKLSEGEKIKGHLPELLSLTNSHYDAKWFSRRIIKKFVVSDAESIQSLWTTVNEKQLMTNQPFNFPEDSVASFVKHYKLVQSTGIGLVLVMENFDRPTKTVAGYFAFFDISTREILDVIRCNGKVGRPGGVTSYIDWRWWPGMEALFGTFNKKYIRAVLNAPITSVTRATRDSIQATRKTKQFISFHLGITEAKLSGSGLHFFDDNSKPGVDIAFTYKFQPSNYFYVKAGAGYISKNIDMRGFFPVQGDFQFIDVPLMVGIQPINIKNSKVVNVGIESGIVGNFDAGSTIDYSPFVKINPKAFVPAFAFGGNLEVKLSEKFLVFANYRVCKDLVRYRDNSLYNYGPDLILINYSYRVISNNLTFGVLMRLP